MKQDQQKKMMQSLVGILLGIALFFSSGLKLPVLDTMTDDYFTGAITKAGVAYATCRVVNASVSIVKESSVHLEPAGVGVSLAVGQALDPIDDMTERLSDVLVMAITSLGVQKLVYEISVSLAPQLISLCLILLSILVWFKHQKLIKLQKSVIQILVVIAIVRFCLPVSSLVNEFIQTYYFNDQNNTKPKMNWPWEPQQWMH